MPVITTNIKQAVIKNLKLPRWFPYVLMGLGATVLVAIWRTPVWSNPEAPHWGYEGEHGPASWGTLAEDYALCELGQQQSPIDLTMPVAAEQAPIAIDYQTSPLKIVNNGHTIEVDYEPGSFITLDGRTYQLLQFHFHRPSEHVVEGSPYDMELHLVHQNPETGDLAVLGVLLTQGQENPALKAVWESMPMTAGSPQTISRVEVDAAQLLPEATDSFYHYHGSLTTPPCSEIVDWVVFTEPVEVSSDQIRQFGEAIPFPNARPAQALNRRFLLESR